MRKRLLCLLTCLSLLLTLLPTAALAAEETTGAEAQAAQTAEYAFTDMELRYAGEQLADDIDTKPQTAYKALVAGIESAQTSISVADYNLTQEELTTVMNAVLSDYPEFFWVGEKTSDGKISTYATTPSGNSTVASVQPVYNSHVSDMDAVEEKVPQTTIDGFIGANDYETALNIHDWLADHVQYVANDEDQNIYGALVDGKAVCAGYARAYQYLLKKAGIEAWYVTGDSTDPTENKTVRHAWTAVHLMSPTDVWYYVDVTWDDQEDTLFHAYFLQSYASIDEDHDFDTDQAALPDTGTVDNYYFQTQGNGTVITDTTSLAADAVVTELKKSGDSPAYTGHFYVTDGSNPKEATAAFSQGVSQVSQQILQALNMSSARFAYSSLGREVILTVSPKYGVTLSQPAGGSIAAAIQGSAQAFQGAAVYGSTVVLTVTPNEGYELVPGTLKVTGPEGQSEVPVSGAGTTESPYTFTMPAYAVTVKAEFREIPGEEPAPSVSVSATSGSWDNALTYGYGSAKTVTYTIQNTGEVQLTNVSVSLSPDSAFTVGTLSPTTIEVGGTATVTVTFPAGKPADTYTGTLTVTADGGAQATADLSQTVNPASLTITNATLASKTYDGTTGATVESVTFDGLQNSDTLVLGTDYTATATFNDANAGDDKTVTVTVTLLDTDNTKNYTLSKDTYQLTGQSIGQATWNGGNSLSLDVPTTGTTGTLDLSSCLPADGQTVNTSVTRDPKTFITAASVIGSMLSYTTAAAADSASGTITVQVTSTNYQAYSIDVTVTARTLSATAGSATISGILDTAMTPVKIPVTLVGDTFAETLSGAWITNLPDGLSQTVERTGDTTATITVSGTPSQEASGPATIAIPAEDLTTNRAAPLTVSGAVGYAIVPTSYSMTVVPTAAVGTTLLDFGEVAFGSTGVASQTFTLTNTGNQTITGLAVTNSSEVFQVTLGAETLAPGKDTIATVTVNPDVNVGTYLIKFLFTYSNGSAEGTAQVKITQAPATTATATGSVLYSDTTEQKISILNAIQSFLAGDETLTYGTVAVTEGGDKLSVTAAQPTVGSDGQLSYYLADNLPAEEGTITMTVEVTGLTNYEKVTVTVTVQIATTAPVITHTITFNANGGSGSMPPDTVADGASYTLPACNFTAPSGMRFAGWRYGITGNQYSAGYTFTTVGTDMAFYAVWETIPTTNPGGSTGGNTGSTGGTTTGGGSSSSSDDSASNNVTTDDNRQPGGTTTETTARPGATVSGGSASTTISASMGDAIVKQATENKSDTVVIAPEISGNVDRTQVTIPNNVVKNIGSDTNADLVVSTPVADVTIPNAGLNQLASQGGRVTVVAETSGSTVTVEVAVGGSPVSAVRSGITVTVPVDDSTPGTVAVLVREDGTREVIRKSLADGGDLIVPLEGSATVEIVDNSKTFTDVPANSWAADAVAFVSSHELFNGTSATTFSPNRTMTRGMLAQVLHNLESNPAASSAGSFADVGSSAYYADAVEWANSNGIVTGYGNGSFGPDNTITRQQLAVMLYRYARVMGYDTSASVSLSGYTDAGQVSDYAATAMAWANAEGLVNGNTATTLNPNGSATRAQVATILMRFCQRYA